MTARRTLTWRMPGAPREVLHRLRDPEVARRRAESDPTLHGVVTELGGDPDGPDALIMTITAELPPSWIPPQVAPRLTTTPRVVRREVWHLDDSGNARADIELRLEGIPATTLSSAGTLTSADPAGTESDLTYDLALTVGVPLLGGAIEKAVLAQVAAGYEKEAHVIAHS